RQKRRTLFARDRRGGGRIAADPSARHGAAVNRFRIAAEETKLCLISQRMKIDVLTLFPGMFAGPLDESIIKRAREAGILELGIHNLRDYTHDRHKTVDDKPFGGGPGMLLKPEPIFEAVEHLASDQTRVVL